MLDSLGFYVPLATKQGFNASVTHIQNALSLLDACNVKKILPMKSVYCLKIKN